MQIKPKYHFTKIAARMDSNPIRAEASITYQVVRIGWFGIGKRKQTIVATGKPGEWGPVWCLDDYTHHRLSINELNYLTGQYWLLRSPDRRVNGFWENRDLMALQSGDRRQSAQKLSVPVVDEPVVEVALTLTAAELLSALEPLDQQADEARQGGGGEFGGEFGGAGASSSWDSDSSSDRSSSSDSSSGGSSND